MCPHFITGLITELFCHNYVGVWAWNCLQLLICLCKLHELKVWMLDMDTEVLEWIITDFIFVCGHSCMHVCVLNLWFALIMTVSCLWIAICIAMFYYVFCALSTRAVIYDQCVCSFFLFECIYVDWQSSVALRLLLVYFSFIYYLCWWWCTAIGVLHLCFVLFTRVCTAVHVFSALCTLNHYFPWYTISYILECVCILPWRLPFTFLRACD